MKNHMIQLYTVYKTHFNQERCKKLESKRMKILNAEGNQRKPH